MGYSENSCQICATSLNIARCRTRSEPPEAGWGYSSGEYYSGDPHSSQCQIFPDLSGCSTEPGEAPSSELHFPGPLCTYTGGYSALRIRADEMKGVNLPRFIVRRPEEHDFDDKTTEYEKKSDFFLTAQTTTPNDDFQNGILEEVRYEIDTLFPNNYDVMGDDYNMDTGVPVHDACWKIFERVSRLRLGRVELQGFMALWKREPCGHCGFQNLKQDPMTAECKQQFWVHEIGTEYLAANPHDIPEFLFSLRSAYGGDWCGDKVFFSRSSTSHPNEKRTAAPTNSTDSFTKLPVEIQTMVLLHLTSKDIASLRLASRSFRQLPKSLFLDLIKKELPWFWEFDEVKDLNAKYWATMGHDDDEAAAWLEKERSKTKKVNWLTVYRKLNMLKKSILGVRNRARIWGVAEDIVERIGMLKERLGVDDDDILPYDLTEAEDKTAGYSKKQSHPGFDCPRCTRAQING